MDDRPYRLLLHGFDTLQCAYYLHAKDDGIFDFRELGVKKESLQHRKSKDPEMIEIGEELFLPHKSRLVYRLCGEVPVWHLVEGNPFLIEHSLMVEPPIDILCPFALR